MQNSKGGGKPAAKSNTSSRFGGGPVKLTPQQLKTAAQRGRFDALVNPKIQEAGLPIGPIADFIHNGLHQAVRGAEGMPQFLFWDAPKAVVSDIAHGRFGGSNSEVDKKIASPMAQGMKHDWADPFLPGGHGLKQLGHNINQNPLMLLDALGGAGAVSKVARIGHAVAETGSLAEGMRASRGLHGEGRVLRVKPEGSHGVEVQVPASPHPMSRAFQHIFDRWSEKYDTAPVGGARKRVAALKAQQINRDAERTVGRMASGAAAIHRPAGLTFDKIKNPALRTRLFWESQMPEELHGGAGLQKLVEQLKTEKNAPIEFTVKPTKNLLMKQQRVDRLEKLFKTAHMYQNTERAKNLEGALNIARGELATAQKAHVGRLAKRDLGAAKIELSRMERDLEKMRNPKSRTGRPLPQRAADETIQKLESTIADRKDRIGRLEQAAEAASNRRSKFLDHHIGLLQDAINVQPTKTYHAALDAAREMTKQREDILREAGAPPEMFDARRSLLSHYLGHEGASDIYVPHRATITKADRISGIIPSRLGGGKTSTRSLGMSKPNELKLLKSGRINPDPDLIVQAWHGAQKFHLQNEIKKFLHQVGQPIDKATGPNDGWLIVNPKGKVLPSWWKDHLKASDEGNVDAIHHGLKSYIQNFIAKPGSPESHQMIDPATGNYMDHVVQVDPRFVKAFQHHLGLNGSGLKTRGGNAFDLTNSLIRASLLYMNPGYIPANLFGNLAFAGLHQGAWLPANIVRVGHMLGHDRELSNLVRAEVGSGPSMALASDAARGAAGAAARAEKRTAHVFSTIADMGPRMTAWVHEARNAGFKTSAQMKELLTSEDPKIQHIRDEVHSRANEAMVNFEKMSPFERQWLTKVFFVWPWVRGATRWAARQAIDAPTRTAFLNREGQHSYQELEKELGMLPPWLRQSILVSLSGDKAKILNASSLNPAGTAAQLGDVALSSWDSFTKDKKLPEGQGLTSLLNPLLGGGLQVAEGRDSFGRSVGQKTAAIDALKSMEPSLARDLINPAQRSSIYAKTGRVPSLERSLRVVPFDISVSGANAQAQKIAASTYTPEEKYQANVSQAETFLKAHGYQLPDQIRGLMALQYHITVAEQKRSSDLSAALTDADRIEVRLPFLVQVRPQYASIGPELMAAVNAHKDNTVMMHKLLIVIDRELGMPTLSRFNHLLRQAEQQAKSAGK